MWMSGQLPMFEEATSPDTRSATSSPAAASGVSRCDGQDGPTADLRGPEAAPAPASRAQGKAAGLMTLVTSGLIGRDSSASASLQSSLENRLMTRLDTDGPTLFRQTWKRRRTPLGRLYLEHTASGRRTSGSGCTSWPTPQQRDHFPAHSEDYTAEKKAQGHGQANLNDHAMLASWSTPRGEDAESAGMRVSRGVADTLTAQTSLCGWATPTACTPNSLRGNGQEPEVRIAGGHSVNLQDQVRLASWPTPQKADDNLSRTPDPQEYSERNMSREGASQNLATVAQALAYWPTPMANKNSPQQRGGFTPNLENVARSVDFGLMPTGFHAAIQRYPEALSGGQLNPEHSLWLMAIPIEWASFVSRAMQSLSARRRRGSKRTAKREG